jgi:hypothetical protein
MGMLHGRTLSLIVERCHCNIAPCPLGAALFKNWISHVLESSGPHWMTLNRVAPLLQT